MNLHSAKPTWFINNFDGRRKNDGAGIIVKCDKANARYCHRMEIVRSRYIVVMFGKQPYQDSFAYLFDIKDSDWRRLDIKGNTWELDRSNFGSVVIKDNIYIYGGESNCHQSEGKKKIY